MTTRWIFAAGAGVFVAVGLFLSGCPSETTPEILIAPTTAAPPARTVNVSQKSLTIRVSRGVAFAFRCWDSCQGVCEGPSFTPGDSKLIDVKPAYRNGTSGVQHVLIAKAAGQTTLQIQDPCATVTYKVQIVE
jgi:hypothetical protein